MTTVTVGTLASVAVVPRARSKTARLVRRAGAAHGGQRPEDQLEVVQQRPRGHVYVVEPHHLLERDVVPSEHLPEAGDAGLQGEPVAPPVDDVLVLLEDERPRADEAHLAP